MYYQNLYGMFHYVYNIRLNVSSFKGAEVSGNKNLNSLDPAVSVTINNSETIVFISDSKASTINHLSQVHVFMYCVEAHLYFTFYYFLLYPSTPQF